MMETMPLPDLPASFFHAATAIRRSSPCAGAAFFVGAAQVIKLAPAKYVRPASLIDTVVLVHEVYNRR